MGIKLLHKLFKLNPALKQHDKLTKFMHGLEIIKALNDLESKNIPTAAIELRSTLEVFFQNNSENGKLILNAIDKAIRGETSYGAVLRTACSNKNQETAIKLVNLILTYQDELNIDINEASPSTNKKPIDFALSNNHPKLYEILKAYELRNKLKVFFQKNAKNKKAILDTLDRAINGEISYGAILRTACSNNNLEAAMHLVNLILEYQNILGIDINEASKSTKEKPIDIAIRLKNAGTHINDDLFNLLIQKGASDPSNQLYQEYEKIIDQENANNRKEIMEEESTEKFLERCQKLLTTKRINKFFETTNVPGDEVSLCFRVLLSPKRDDFLKFIFLPEHSDILKNFIDCLLNNSLFLNEENNGIFLISLLVKNNGNQLHKLLPTQEYCKKFVENIPSKVITYDFVRELCATQKPAILNELINHHPEKITTQEICSIQKDGSSMLLILCKNNILELKTLLKKHPEIIDDTALFSEALFHDNNLKLCSPLYQLSKNNDGVQLLNFIFDRNPAILHNLTPDKICKQFNPQKENKSVLSHFYYTQESGTIKLRERILKEPSLYKTDDFIEMIGRTLCQPIEKNMLMPSILYFLLTSLESKLLLEMFALSGHKLEKYITIEDLCFCGSNLSAFSFLASKIVLADKLFAFNPDLDKHPEILGNALCATTENTTPSLSKYFQSVSGRNFIKERFDKNGNLAKYITIDALYNVYPLCTISAIEKLCIDVDGIDGRINHCGVELLNQLFSLNPKLEELARLKTLRHGEKIIEALKRLRLHSTQKSTITATSQVSQSNLQTQGLFASVNINIDKAQELKAQLNTFFQSNSENGKFILDAMDKAIKGEHTYSVVLRTACSYKNHNTALKLVSLILTYQEELGIDIDEPSKTTNKKPIDYAKNNNNSELCKLLKAYELKDKLKTFFQTDTKNGKIILEILFRAIKGEVSYGAVLRSACSYKNHKMAEKLVALVLEYQNDLGIDINEASIKTQEKPLDIAKRLKNSGEHKNESLCDLLIKHGAYTSQEKLPQNTVGLC